MDEQFIRAISIRWDKIDPDSYIRDIPALVDMTEMTFSTPITFFVGENGSGKSTLLEAIAVASGFNPEGGTKNYCFSTYDSHSDLHEALFVTRGIRKPGWGYFLRAESFYNVATMDEEYGKLPGGVPHDFHKKSHGESFLATVQENFKPNGLYILDEPEAALSPQRQLTLLLEINGIANQESQFIIATHSPILLGMPGARILSFDNGYIHEITYEETESYQVTEMFINNREALLRRLLSQ